jgi:hypothetical protein
MEKYYQVTSAMRCGDNITKIASSRGSAADKVANVLEERNLEVEDIYYRDDPHKHNEVMKCNDGSLIFIDRVMIA